MILELLVGIRATGRPPVLVLDLGHLPTGAFLVEHLAVERRWLLTVPETKSAERVRRWHSTAWTAMSTAERARVVAVVGPSAAQLVPVVAGASRVILVPGKGRPPKPGRGQRPLSRHLVAPFADPARIPDPRATEAERAIWVAHLETLLAPALIGQLKTKRGAAAALGSAFGLGPKAIRALDERLGPPEGGAATAGLSRHWLDQELARICTQGS